MKYLARGDYSQIEARVLPWLAGAEWKLDAFRAYDNGTGPDLYKVAAAGILNKPHEEVTKEERQGYGKVSELALGFQGGPDALQNMARAYGVKIPMQPRVRCGQCAACKAAEPGKCAKPRPDLSLDPATGTDLWIVQRWRAKNPEVADREEGLWKRLETAAADCVRAPPGDVFHVGKLSFRRNARCLAMRLPSGRNLVYWNARLERITTSWGAEKWAVSYHAENAMTKAWEKFHAYGGLWTENAVQAAARDIMLAALLNAEECGLPPCLTVHDEMICEVEAPDTQTAAGAVHAAMLDLPDWCAGLPVSADASAAKRYLK